MTTFTEITHNFDDEFLTDLFKTEKTDEFFEALLGDSDEGAYDIELTFSGIKGDHLEFLFNLKRRPGKCLACHLTYGLPQVFSRHPTLDVKGIVEKIGNALNGSAEITRWSMGETREVTSDLHVIPLKVFVQKNE